MFVVIENTPGYLPDDDDPPTFEDMREANAYLQSEVERFCEYLSTAGERFTVAWSNDYPDESTSAHVARVGHHDLGRYFEIIDAR